jgi:hypothetical protein
MLYKPRYCCHCGDRIERVEWHLWTNRRFCEICETEYLVDDWLKRILPTIFLFLGVFGIGSYFISENEPLKIANAEKKASGLAEKNQKNVSGQKLPDAKSGNHQQTENKNDSGIDEKHRKTAPLKQNEISDNKNEQAVEVVRSPQKKSTLPVYFCGAETKKGTPCSRRVKGGGRCWQHAGREAILSEKELKIESN